MVRNGEATNARARILEVACELFGERGFDAVSVADLAAASGISTGLIYYHFTDKQTLYETAVRESVHLLEDASVRALASEGSAAERIRGFVAEYMVLLDSHESLMRLLIRTVSDRGGHTPGHVLMRSGAIIDRLQAVIEEGISGGEFRQLDAHLAAAALFALINTLVTARALDTPLGVHGDADVSRQSAFMSELFLEGVSS
jgi:AcrR family transcriptional regulator